MGVCTFQGNFRAESELSLHADLLAQAKHLARKEPRRPKQASLRKAVSSGYYALFHLLIDEASTFLIRGAKRSELRNCLARAFKHAAMKQVAQAFSMRRPNESMKIAPALRGLTLQSELVSVASAFVDLQQARHEADYDRARVFGRQEVLDFLDLVEQAFQNWRVVRSTPQADAFLVALLAEKHMQG